MNAVLFVTNVKLLSTNSKLNIVFDWLIDDNFGQRVNTIYDSLVITILDNTKHCYFNLRQVLQLTTTVSYNLPQVLQFTTEQTSHLGSLSINDGHGYENVT